MTTEQIAKLVAQRNESSVREMEYRANDLINNICKLQQEKKDADDQIAECRKELLALNAAQASVADVTGNQ